MQHPNPAQWCVLWIAAAAAAYTWLGVEEAPLPTAWSHGDKLALVILALGCLLAWQLTNAPVLLSRARTVLTAVCLALRSAARPPVKTRALLFTCALCIVYGVSYLLWPPAPPAPAQTFEEFMQKSHPPPPDESPREFLQRHRP